MYFRVIPPYLVASVKVMRAQILVGERTWDFESGDGGIWECLRLHKMSSVSRHDR